jgi:hypothetical protein
MGLGSAADAAPGPCLRDHRDADELTAVDTMPPPPPPAPPPPPRPPPTASLVAPEDAVDVTSTTVHSRPLARKTRLVAVLGRPPGGVAASGPSPGRAVVVVVVVASAKNENTSAAIAGCTCELCANDAILVAVTPLSFGNGDDGDGRPRRSCDEAPRSRQHGTA